MTDSQGPDIIASAAPLTGVHVETVNLTEDFLTMAARFAPLPGTVVLASGGDLDSARQYILGALPWLEISARHEGGTLTIDGTRVPLEGDPFEVLRHVLHRFRLPDDCPAPPPAAGLLGYLAYDLKDHIETLPRTCVDDLQLPTMLLYAPSVLLVQDRGSGETRMIVPQRGEDLAPTAAIIDRAREILAGPTPEAAPTPSASRPLAGISRADYEQSVRSIVEAIAAGDIYQANFTQRFRASFTGDAFTLFGQLFERNPAPFFAYVQGGDHQVVSTSPERFLQRVGDQVESRPIKGTRPRGDTPEADVALSDELQKSPKDDAELSMIVDLVRNDLGKVCREGSVEVKEHKRLESYRNVHHLVSRVTGRLDTGVDTVDLIRAAFPGGSITGCPKIRAMEIIDELESSRRHVYCGSIGYLGFDDSLDLSIAIRTATIMGGTMTWSVGGGIVYDSDPADEYEESLHKGRTLAEACSGPDALDTADPLVWHNGRLVPLSTAGVPVIDLGLLRGYGLFETLRVDRGQAPLLADHVARLEASWRQLMPSDPPDLHWNDIVSLVVQANGFLERPTMVRIIATRGSREQAPWDHSITVMAQPYTHRLEASGAPGLRIGTYPEPRQTPLAAHKTLSYIYNNQAAQWARNRGYDEALILNTDGTVSEGNSTGMLVIVGKRVIRPESLAALPSVMAGAVCRLLASWDHEIVVAPVRPEELMTADLVLSTSGMMGAIPVFAIDGRERAVGPDLWRRVNDVIIPGWGGFGG